MVVLFHKLCETAISYPEHSRAVSRKETANGTSPKCHRNVTRVTLNCCTKAVKWGNGLKPVRSRLDMTGSRIPYLLFNPSEFKRENRWKLQVIVGRGAGKSDKAGQSWTHSFEQERTEETERRSKRSAACHWREENPLEHGVSTAEIKSKITIKIGKKPLRLNSMAAGTG